MKTLVVILAGRGPSCKYDDERFETFHTNSKYDVIAFYNKDQYPDWQPKHFKLVHNGMPYTGTVSNISRLRNNILQYADDNNYEALWMIDDDARQFYHYKPYTAKDLEEKKLLQYDKFTLLPEIEHPFGGMLGANFKRFKMATGQKYSNQMPVGCIYFNLKQLKSIMKEIPKFEEKILLWDDYDFFLKLRKAGIVPMTFNEYSFIKPQTQDQKASGDSIASSGIEKVCNMGFNLYKRYGSENCICKKKINILDVHPAMTKKFFPVHYRYRIDSLDHFLEDAYNDDDTKYVRSSEKIKKGEVMLWTKLFVPSNKPKSFKFGL